MKTKGLISVENLAIQDAPSVPFYLSPEDYVRARPGNTLSNYNMDIALAARLSFADGQQLLVDRCRERGISFISEEDALQMVREIMLDHYEAVERHGRSKS